MNPHLANLLAQTARATTRAVQNSVSAKLSTAGGGGGGSCTPCAAMARRAEAEARVSAMLGKKPSGKKPR